ncbi:uncharacterized protein LOC143902603 isoform X2 [Temnothorax americanus]|uniref:uncharacterized protein LOC143902603 isoform X2 n=1 Tax=Temnothorax americanus TaxID=1964332 RepID=UPI004068268B
MDSQEQIRVVYTCGLCEEICEKIPGHPCLEGYTRLYIDQNHYFYPMLDDGKSIVRRSMMPGNKEAIVMDNQENLSPNIPEPVRLSKKSTGVPIAKTARNKKLTDVEVELLILEVQKRTPLWDISSPLEKRNRETVRRLWNEVSVELNGKLDGTEAQKKFKSLRDTFRKFVQTEQHASGSARPDIKEKWKYYDTMEFLRDSCLLRPTHTNVSQDLQEEADHTTTPNDDDRDDISTTISIGCQLHGTHQCEAQGKAATGKNKQRFQPLFSRNMPFIPGTKYLLHLILQNRNYILISEAKNLLLIYFTRCNRFHSEHRVLKFNIIKYQT